MNTYSRRAIILEDSWKLTMSKDFSSAEIIMPLNDYKNIAFEEALENILNERFTVQNYDELTREIQEAIISNTEENKKYEYAIKDDKRTVKLQITKNIIFIKICGIPPKEGKNGFISKHHFIHETIPGEIDADGKIDFTNIKKYPSCKAHNILLTIKNPTKGKDGLSYCGEIIKTKETKNYPIRIGIGCEDNSAKSLESKSEEFIITSKIDGIISCKKNSKKEIVTIAVSKELVLKTINLKEGSIGMDYACPVPIRLTDGINPGFKLKSLRNVSAENVNGGEITTEENIKLRRVTGGSIIFAKESIFTEFVKNSKLKGKIIIVIREISDASISSDIIKTPRNKTTVVSNLSLEANQIELENCLISGKNKINIGTSLFNSKNKIPEEKKKLFLSMEKKRVTKKNIETNFKTNLRKIFPLIIKDKQEKFKKLINKLGTLSIEKFKESITEFKTHKNLNNIKKLKKLFKEQREIEQTLYENQQCIIKLDQKKLDLEFQISNIQLKIRGSINTTASLVITCRDQQYIHETSSKRTQINSTGKYYEKTDRFIIQ